MKSKLKHAECEACQRNMNYRLAVITACLGAITAIFAVL